MPGVANETVYSRAGAFFDVGRWAYRQQLWPTADGVAGCAEAGRFCQRRLDPRRQLNVPLTMGTPMATSETSLELRLPSDPTMSGQSSGDSPPGIEAI